MKKLLVYVCLAAAALVLFAGCGGEKLPEGMDAAALESQAKTFIDAVSAQDYDEVVAQFTDTGAHYSAAEWEGMLGSYIASFGAFKSYKSTNIATVDDATYGEVAVVLLETEYEEQTIIWQVSINQEYEIIGLHL